jgi:ribosomal protein S18 acetylase RimI-like enzyme
MAFAFRTATAADAAALAEFAERTFRETFGPDNRPEDMELYIAGSYGADHQRAEILEPALVTLLAEAGGTLAGFVQLRRGKAPACVSGPTPVEIWRFYVDRSWQGRGLAGRMMAEACAGARAGGGQTVWLAVWERNARAIAFYRKCGFAVVGEQPFLLGTDQQNDFVMARGLGA